MGFFCFVFFLHWHFQSCNISTHRCRFHTSSPASPIRITLWWKRPFPPIAPSLQVLSFFQVWLCCLRKAEGPNNGWLLRSRLGERSTLLPSSIGGQQTFHAQPYVYKSNLIGTLRLSFKDRWHSALQLHLKIPIQAKNLCEPNIKRTTEFQVRQQCFRWTEPRTGKDSLMLLWYPGMQLRSRLSASPARLNCTWKYGRALGNPSSLLF